MDSKCTSHSNNDDLDILSTTDRFMPSANVLVVGKNERGQFGIDHRRNITDLSNWQPETANMHAIRDIHVGNMYFIITDQNGHHWGAGATNSGELISRSPMKQAQFREIEFFEKHMPNVTIQRIFSSVTGSNTFWLTTDDKVYAHGRNDYNQLGIARKREIYEPILIEGLSGFRIRHIHCGHGHCIALDAAGNVYATKGSGRYYHGQNGGNAFLSSEDTGFHRLSFFVDRKLNIKLIAAGLQHSIFVDESNGVWSSGANGYHRQCGLAANISDTLHIPPQQIVYFAQHSVSVLDVQCGANHTLLLSQQGSVYSFGRNLEGQCGVGSDAHFVCPPHRIDAWHKAGIVQIKCGYNHSYAKSANGCHYLFGQNANNECCLIRRSTQFVDVVRTPLCIDDTVYGRLIEHVYLGYGSTWIMLVSLSELLVVGFMKGNAAQFGMYVVDELMNIVIMFYTNDYMHASPK